MHLFVVKVEQRLWRPVVPPYTPGGLEWTLVALWLRTTGHVVVVPV